MLRHRSSVVLLLLLSACGGAQAVDEVVPASCEKGVCGTGGAALGSGGSSAGATSNPGTGGHVIVVGWAGEGGALSSGTGGSGQAGTPGSSGSGGGANLLCTPGGLACHGDQVQACNKAGDAWTDIATCGPGLCVTDRCVECLGSVFECKPGTQTPRQCVDGKWKESAPCSGNTAICEDGACVAPQTPCTGICENPKVVPIEDFGETSKLGKGASCWETTGTLYGGTCGNFEKGRIFAVNGVEVDCSGGGKWPDLSVKRAGGYCVYVGAGNNEFAYFDTWLP